MKHDIFISYRRETGFEAARMIQERLKNNGYRVFLDFEELRSGNFNKQLYEKIESCKDFILIVSPRCFDRCSEENDWLRLEIVHALKLGKNIIPVMLRNSGFPEPMPTGMDNLKYMQGVSANQEFFDASIKKLKKFLLSKPNIVRKHSTPLLIVAIVLCLSAVFYAFYQKSSDRQHVRTVSCSSAQGQNQKRFVQEQIGNLVLLNEMVYEMNTEIKASLKDHDTYQQLKQTPSPNSWSERLRYQINKWENREFVNGDYKNKSLFSNEDLNIYVENYLSQELDAIKKTFEETFTTFHQLYAGINPTLWLVHSEEHIALRKEVFDLQARDYLLIMMGTSEFLCEEAKAELEEILPKLTEFGDDNKFITYEESERMCETNLERLEEKIRVMSTYIGDEQVNLRTKQIEYDHQEQLLQLKRQQLSVKGHEGIDAILDVISYLDQSFDKSNNAFDIYFPMIKKEWEEGNSHSIAQRKANSRVICSSFVKDYSDLYIEDKIYTQGLNAFVRKLSALGLEDGKISTLTLELESIISYKKNILSSISSLNESASLREGLNNINIVGVDKKIQDNHIQVFYQTIKEAFANISDREYQEITKANKLFSSLNKFKFSVEELIEERESLLSEKQSYVDKMESQLDDIKEQIRSGHETIKEQCKVLPDDDAWLVWGKMIRLLYLNFKTEALENLSAFEEKMKKSGEDPSSYTIPTRLFIQKKYNIDCQCGIVVAGFKDNLTHSSLHVGDIITKIDKQTIVTVMDFSESRKKAGLENAVMYVYRYDPIEKDFFEIECRTIVGDPLIAVLSLTEH